MRYLSLNRLLPLLVTALAMTAAIPATAHAQAAVPARTVTIGDASVVEGNGRSKLSFPITVDGPVGTITLIVATRPGTALAGGDFTPGLAVFTIAVISGPNRSYSFEVPVTGDLVPEPTETLTVAYRVIPVGEPVPPAGAPGVGGTPDLASEPTAATGTIIDDDAPTGAPGAGTPPAPVAPAPVTAVSQPTLNNVATLPSSKRCVSRRKFRIRLRSPQGATIASATVKLRGKTVATRSGRRVTAPIDLRGLPKGRVTVSIRVVLTDGRVINGSRRYRTCVPRPSATQTPKV